MARDYPEAIPEGSYAGRPIVGRQRDTDDYVRFGAPVTRDEQPDVLAERAYDGWDYRTGRFTSGWSDDDRVSWAQVGSYIEDGRTDEATGVPYSGFWTWVAQALGWLAETSRPYIRPRESVFWNKRLMGFGQATFAAPDYNRTSTGPTNDTSNEPARRNDPPPGPFPAGWERVSSWPRSRTRYKLLGE